MVTGIDLSDKHIKKRYLEVGKYLTADLVVVRSELTLPGSKDAEGTLKLHGQSKTIKFHYDVTK